MRSRRCTPPSISDCTMRPLTASHRCGLGMKTAVLKAEVRSRMALRPFWHRRRESVADFAGPRAGRVPVVCGERRQRVLILRQIVCDKVSMIAGHPKFAFREGHKNAHAGFALFFRILTLASASGGL